MQKKEKNQKKKKARLRRVHNIQPPVLRSDLIKESGPLRGHLDETSALRVKVSQVEGMRPRVRLRAETTQKGGKTLMQLYKEGKL